MQWIAPSEKDVANRICYPERIEGSQLLNHESRVPRDAVPGTHERHETGFTAEPQRVQRKPLPVRLLNSSFLLASRHSQSKADQPSSRLCRMNLAVHGLEGDIRQAITTKPSPKNRVEREAGTQTRDPGFAANLYQSTGRFNFAEFYKPSEEQTVLGLKA